MAAVCLYRVHFNDTIVIEIVTIITARRTATDQLFRVRHVLSIICHRKQSYHLAQV